ncbi:hypothetical protein [Clostridium merdae]|nr:hypothetical protein [Clostridium merdae]
MSDYKEMYYLLFNKITDIVTDLQEIQRHTEELYIKTETPLIKLSLREKE